MANVILATFYVPGGNVIMSSTDGAAKMAKLLDLRRTQIENMTPVYNRFGDYLVKFHIPYQYEMQGRPYKWRKLSKKYAAYKKRVRPGAPILVFNGTMRAGFGYEVRGQGDLWISNTQDYARYHQTGTEKMPARKWLQLTDPDYDQLHKFAREHIMREYGAPQ